MKTRILMVLLTALLLAVSQVAAENLEPQASDVKLPSGKSQAEEILKADYEKTLKDAADLLKLAGELKEDLEKNDRHVLSISTLKKTEEIEKLAKRIRSRLRRF